MLHWITAQVIFSPAHMQYTLSNKLKIMQQFCFRVLKQRLGKISDVSGALLFPGQAKRWLLQNKLLKIWRDNSFFLILILKTWLLKESFQFMVLHNSRSLSTTWQQQWLTSTWLVLQGEKYHEAAFLRLQKSFSLKEEHCRWWSISRLSWDVLHWQKTKNVSDPFDQEGSEPPSQCSPRDTIPCSGYTAASLLLAPDWN